MERAGERATIAGPMGDIALVTGAAGALGSEVARRLRAQGCSIALVDSPRAGARLEELRRELGPESCTAVGDLATANAWVEISARVRSALGGEPNRVALVAGAWGGGKRFFEESDDSVWNAMLKANLETVHRAFAALLPSMVAAKRGSVVVVGSRAVERPWTSTRAAAYSASKAAVVALARTVAEEVLSDGVRINAVLPSTMDTPANRAAMPDANFSSWVTTASAAGVVAFLLSDDARDVSGAALPLYGRA
jgi:NAD(P)-dependent dehydrogenase (short-subunit alcohol dehydrogenase family)